MNRSTMLTHARLPHPRQQHTGLRLTLAPRTPMAQSPQSRRCAPLHARQQRTRAAAIPITRTTRPCKWRAAIASRLSLQVRRHFLHCGLCRATRLGKRLCAAPHPLPGAGSPRARPPHPTLPTAGGSLYMWGCLHHRALPRPTLVATPSPVVRVACGHKHVLACTVQGRVLAWGNGFAGRLGLGDETGVAHPTFVRALDADTPISRVAAGGAHSLAISGASRLSGLGLGGRVGRRVGHCRGTIVIAGRGRMS